MPHRVHKPRLKVFSLGTAAVVCGAVLAGLTMEGWQSKHTSVLYVPIVSVTSFTIGWYLSKKHYVSDSYL